jgi:hypothetical protein
MFNILSLLASYNWNFLLCTHFHKTSRSELYIKRSRCLVVPASITVRPWKFSLAFIYSLGTYFYEFSGWRFYHKSIIIPKLYIARPIRTPHPLLLTFLSPYRVLEVRISSFILGVTILFITRYDVLIVGRVLPKSIRC